MPKLAKDKYCTGCLACKDACRHGAISVVLKNGMPFPKVNTDMCVECKLCEKVCPIVFGVCRNDVSKEAVFGGWIKDNNIRKQAASGGAFAALAKDFLENHSSGIVIGASLEDNHVRHICIDKIDNLGLLLNSKYVQSRTDGIYRQVVEYLKEDRCVLFSGLPCQVAGLYGYIGKRETLKKNLWTIDLICHGVASQEALDLHLQYYHADEILAFRRKETFKLYGTSQCTTLLVDNKKITIDRKKDVFYNIFASWLTDRPSCHDCKFARLARVADITIGDFWGKKGCSSDGVSLILANNKHGRKIVQETKNLHLWKATMRDAIYSNANLWMGWKATKWHPMVLWAEGCKWFLPNQIRFCILTRKGIWKLIWAPFKVITICYIKFAKIIILKKYKDVL